MNFKKLFATLFVASPLFITAQVVEMKLDDLSQFKNPSANWMLAGDVSSDYTKSEDLQVFSGKGILVNKPSSSARNDLYSAWEHGDLDLELEFMIPKNSNSGIYLQGKYEMQLFDSWGVLKPKASDCGGIYERWDDSKPDGKKGYEGIPPRQNSLKAPGLWNKLKLSFKAPVFKEGKKIRNAQIVYLYINDALIHENLEISGPTRGATSGDEVAKGPLRIQGDHGPVAFRNIKYLLCNPDEKIKIYDISYAYYEHKFNSRFDVWNYKPKKEGKLDLFSIDMIEIPDEYAVTYKAKMEIFNPGEYTFEAAFNGHIHLILNKTDTLIKSEPHHRDYERNLIKSVTLKPGIYDLNINYWKIYPWMTPTFGMFVSGPGVKLQPMHHPNSLPPLADPLPHIISTETKPKIMRAFLTYDNKIITHTAFVGDPTGMHYAINPENMAFLQFWRGAFVDLGPAWDERGGNPINVLGPVNLARNTPSLAFLNDSKTAWPDSVNKNSFKFKAYSIEADNRPMFTYLSDGLTVNDKFTPAEGGKSLNRELKIEGKADTKNLYALIAVGTSFKQQKDGSYIVGDKEYFLKIDPALKPQIRDAKGKKEMIVPVSLANGPAKVSYSLTW